MTKYNLLYIDDDAENLELYKSAFSDLFNIDTTLDPNEALNLLNKKIYEGILVDIHMPTMDGFELISKVKQHVTGKDASLFILSSDASLDSKLQGLKAGISDYLYKLMHIDEMALRIKNGIETIKEVTPIKTIDNLKVNFNTFQVSLNDEHVPLTLTEYKILMCLANSEKLSCEIESLKSFVYHIQYVSDNSFRVHLANLRRKLADWSHEILTKGKSIKLIKR